jgi:serine/threonine protein kinase
MSTTIQRRGWESLPETENEQLASNKPDSGNAIGKEAATIRQKATWCNLIATLQRRGLAGFRMSLSAPGDPVGKGTYFAVWRHRIRDEEERLAYQDQDREILPIGTVLALKRVIPRINSRTGEIDLDDDKQLRAVALEVRALSFPQLREHQNIVTLIGVVWEPRGGDSAAWPTLILEFCDTNLSECQRTILQPIAIEEKLRLAKGIAAGLAAIHSLGVVHGDIKSENILLKFDEAGHPTPKLADFGCSLLDLEIENDDAGNNMVWIGGTNPWRAPEVRTHSPQMSQNRTNVMKVP